MVQLLIRQSDQERQFLSNQSGPLVASTFYASDAIDVRGFTWVDFQAVINSNSGGTTDIAELDAIIEFAHIESPSTWQVVKVEDVDRTSGTGNLNDLVLTDPVAGTPRDQGLFTVPVFGAFMRIRIAPDSAAVPNPSASLSFYAMRRN